MYVPKFLTKSVAPFMYNDQNPAHSNFNYSDKTNRVFGNTSPKEEYMLGIQTLYGKIGASVVTNKGKILSNETKQLFKHRGTAGNISNEFLHEFMNENISIVVDDAIKTAGVKYENLKGITVTIAPGETYTLATGLDFAKKLGIDKNIPVYPVSTLCSLL